MCIFLSFLCWNVFQYMLLNLSTTIMYFRFYRGSSLMQPQAHIRSSLSERQQQKAVLHQRSRHEPQGFVQLRAGTQVFICYDASFPSSTHIEGAFSATADSLILDVYKNNSHPERQPLGSCNNVAHCQGSPLVLNWQWKKKDTQ